MEDRFLKTFFTYTLVILIFALNVFCNKKAIKQSENKGFLFVLEPPVFTKEQKEFIQKNFCKIFSNIPEPYLYFINEIFTTEKGLTVKIYPLSVLQAGSNESKTQIVFPSGKTWFVYFDKEEKYLATEER